MNFAASLGCTAVGLRPPSVAPQTRLKPTTETRQRSTYKKAKAVQTNGATSVFWYDGLGASLYAKRLEKGRFVWPATHDGVVVITPGQLGYLLEGIDWRHPQHTWRPEIAG